MVELLEEKDICVLVPTYNRPKDVDNFIKSLISIGKPGKSVILDQSANDDTEKLIRPLSKRYRFIEYRHYNIRGKNIVLNRAIDEFKKKYKLIFLLDDDIVLERNFFKNVLDEFNKNSRTKVVGAVDVNDLQRFKRVNVNSARFKIVNGILRFLLLPCMEDHRFRILGPYGNTMSPRVLRDIRDCQWMSGFVLCCRNEIFEDYRIPDRIGYDVSEDIDLGYHTYTKYGSGSLVIPKNVRVKHNYSLVERYADKKRIFVNHEDHFTFYYRNFYNATGTAKFIWGLFWINILNVTRAIFKPSKVNLLKVKYLWMALAYCTVNRKKIRAGRSRMFLNPDLSMKKEYQ